MSTEVIKVTINGKDFQVPKGARLIDVCREKGFDIPSFCYYSDLALQASCRMCLVRIEKMPKLQTSCTITCTDGMVVTTQSEEIEKAQRGMVEFLCIKGRFAHPFVNHEERLRTPLVRYKKGGRLVPATWDEAVRFASQKLKGVIDASGGNSVGVVGS